MKRATPHYHIDHPFDSRRFKEKKVDIEQDERNNGITTSNGSIKSWKGYPMSTETDKPRRIRRVICTNMQFSGGLNKPSNLSSSRDRLRKCRRTRSHSLGIRSQGVNYEGPVCIIWQPAIEHPYSYRIEYSWSSQATTLLRRKTRVKDGCSDDAELHGPSLMRAKRHWRRVARAHHIR